MSFDANGYPLASALQKQFDELSRNRDTPSESVTEERYIPTDDGGFIHEVTSRTTPRRRPDSGEEVSTVTQRRVATVANPEAILHAHNTPSSTLSLKYSSKSLQSSRSPSASTTATSTMYNGGSSSGYNNNSNNNNNNSGINVSPGPSSYFSGNQNQNQQQARSIIIDSNADNNNNNNNNNFGNWRYNSNTVANNNNNNNINSMFQNEPTYQQSQMNSMVPPHPRGGTHFRQQQQQFSGPGGRNVKIGTVQTSIVEPFRISPLNPERNYAPLKYVTRRQLREMQQRGTHRNLPNKLRTSSVPKLDEMLLQEQQERVITAAAAAAGAGGRVFNNNYNSSNNNNNNNNNNDNSQSYEPERDVVAGYYYNNHRSASQHSNGSSNGGYSAAAANGAGSYYYDNFAMTSGRSLPLPPVDGDEMVDRFAYSLSWATRDIVPPAPAYCGAAMRLLLRGTYLVHYGRQPHERYFMLRMITDQHDRPQPFFVWSLHADSASYSERIHLVHLVGVGRGTSSDRFRRFEVDSRCLVGPYVGDKHSRVSSKYAFSLVFESQHARRQVDVLALDDQTFRCWLLVCDYLADVNARRRELVEGGNAGAGEGGNEQQKKSFQEYQEQAESMAPDTPRSHVSGN